MAKCEHGVWKRACAKQQLVEASEYHYMLGFLREFRDLAKSFRCTP